MNEPALGSASPLIPIQVSGADSPVVVCLPGAGLSVTCFLALADAVGRDVSLYGLQTRGLDGLTAPHPTVEAAALDYMAWLGRSCAGDAYQLLGHSFGGWIAFEMACRLTEAGAIMNRLVLLDTQPPASPGDEAPDKTRVEVLMELIDSLEHASGATLSLSQAELESVDPAGQLRKLAQAMRRSGVLPSVPSLNMLSNIVSVFELSMNTRYVPSRRFPGQIVLVQPEEYADDDEWTPEEAFRAWQDHAAQVVRIAVPGNHMSMLESPGIDRVARELWLER